MAERQWPTSPKGLLDHMWLIPSDQEYNYFLPTTATVIGSVSLGLKNDTDSDWLAVGIRDNESVCIPAYQTLAEGLSGNQDYSIKLTNCKNNQKIYTME